MLNIETLFLYFFIFSILTTLRVVVKVVSALLQENPKPLVFSSRELILYGALISYLITYIISN